MIYLSTGLPNCPVISLTRVEAYSLSDDSFFGIKTAGSQHALPVERDVLVLWQFIN